MTTGTAIERESNLQVTSTAMVAFKVGGHGVLHAGFLDRGKNLRMAELTAVPNRMLLMREEYRMYPHVAGLEGEVFSALDAGLLHCDAFDGVNRLHFPGAFSRFPIDAVNRFRERCSERLVLELANALFV